LDDPHRVYTARRDEAARLRGVLEQREGRLANARLVAFLLLVGMGVWTLAGAPYPAALLALPLGLFLTLVHGFDRAARRRERAERLVGYHERGLARLEDRWAGLGETGERFREPDHLYADDLDLFGRGSLFERISTARTAAGEATLAAWLLGPAAPGVVRERQEAVAELRGRLDLREDLVVLGGGVGASGAFGGLAAWGAEPRRLDHPATRVVAFVLAVLTPPALAGWLWLGWPAWPFLALGAAELALAVWFFGRVRAALGHVDERAEELSRLSGLLGRLERERFSAPLLERARAALFADGAPASREIRRLVRIVATLEARRNLLLAPVSPLLLWGTQCAFAIEAWRGKAGPAIGGWLAALGEVEALASLGAFAFENPGDVFPEVVEEAGATFEAVGLAHPLLAAAKAVRNDVRLGGEGAARVLVVSGSNMSGKSTLLRAVGCAAVLSQAGGTVRASALRMSPLAIGATLRIQDSLQAGRSRFYAEILRLRALLDRAAEGSPPLLFLLDEVLAGTNSHDRRIGAEAVIRGLEARGAIGLVTTHDLTLAEIAASRPGVFVNVHFADRFEDGALVFDYRMREGVVDHSNALELMRSIGLEV
jgi:hypothetical protein